MPYYSADVIEEVQGHIDAYYKLKKVPIEVAWEAILEVWEREKITHIVDLSVDDTLCHPPQQGGYRD